MKNDTNDYDLQKTYIGKSVTWGKTVGKIKSAWLTMMGQRAEIPCILLNIEETNGQMHYCVEAKNCSIWA